MNPLSREAIATAPEFTNRTPFALVVDALLVRATDDAIRHRNGQYAVLFHEFQISRATPASPRMSPWSTFQLRISATSAFSNGTIPTATFVAWLRFGP